MIIIKELMTDLVNHITNRLTPLIKNIFLHPLNHPLFFSTNWQNRNWVSVSHDLFLASTAGMEALYEVKRCSYQDSGSALKGKLRQYYIAAKEVRWNYGPSGLDPNTGKSLREPNRYVPLIQGFKCGFQSLHTLSQVCICSVARSIMGKKWFFNCWLYFCNKRMGWLTKFTAWVGMQKVSMNVEQW